MILIINEEKELEEIVEAQNFSNMGVLEVEHMQKWIAQNPEILNESLMTISTEYDGFDKTNRRLDIMALDPTGKLVIIELKRDIADRFVDLQAIHYAAYCSTFTFDDLVEIAAEYYETSKNELETKIRDFLDDDFKELDSQPRIILVANDFLDETIPAVLWLRDFGVDISCVKLEAYKLDNKIAITPDIIIPLPEAKEFMTYREEKAKITSKTNTLHEKYKTFWSKMLKSLNEAKPGLSRRKYCQSNYLPIPTGKGNVHFEWLFRGNPLQEFLVALHFEYNDYEENIKLLNHFKQHKEEIRTSFPDEEIVFDEHFYSKWAQIYIKRDSGNLDEENLEWGFKTMMKFYDTLKPILDNYFMQK